MRKHLALSGLWLQPCPLRSQLLRNHLNRTVITSCQMLLWPMCMSKAIECWQHSEHPHTRKAPSLPQTGDQQHPIGCIYVLAFIFLWVPKYRISSGGCTKRHLHSEAMLLHLPCHNQ